MWHLRGQHIWARDRVALELRWPAVVLPLLVLLPIYGRAIVRAAFCTAVVVLLLLLHFVFKIDWACTQSGSSAADWPLPRMLG